MRRPAHQEKTLERIARWRDICPDLAIRSTFIVGFPGETERDFQILLDWLKEAKLARVGCFKYEPVEGAPANAIAGVVPDEVKEERWHRFMAAQQEVSRDADGRQGRPHHRRHHRRGGRGRRHRPLASGMRPRSTAPSSSTAPPTSPPGDMIQARVTNADEYDLWADPIAPGKPQ